MRWFYVLEEGGLINYAPLAEVRLRALCGAPIFGAEIPGKRVVYDRILRGLGRDGYSVQSGKWIGA